MESIVRMTDEEILDWIDELTKSDRLKDIAWFNKSAIVSFNIEDFTIWIYLGEGYSVPECREKNLKDYQSFTIWMFDPDDGDSFGSPFSKGAIYPSKDIRFQGQSWSNHFFFDKRAASVPVADFCQIIRFLQKVHKLTAFL